MSKEFHKLDFQRRALSWAGGVLIASLCAALVLVSWSSDGVTISIDQQRWPTLVGLIGLVVVFVLYVQYKHREIAQMEAKLRESSVREATLQARFSEISFLFDVTTQLQLRLDLQGMLDLAAQRLLPCLDADQSSVMLHNAETGILEVKATAGQDTNLVTGNRVTPGEGVAGHVFATGEVVRLTPDVVKKRFPDAVKPGRTLAAGLCVPMRFRGTPIGVVSVTRSAGEPFTDLHAQMLETFADHCAATVVKTHHHHELLKHVKRAA